jgi:signal transduction histidine kinase
LLLVVVVIFIRIFIGNKTKLIFHLYNIILALIPITLYAKILFHTDIGRLFSNVIGAIVAILVVSLDLKVKFKYSIIIIIIPYIIFLHFVFNYFDDFDNIHLVFINISPIIILGFISNYLQNNLRFKLFKTNFLLKDERDKVNDLNEEISNNNEELHKLDATKNKFFSIIAHDLRAPFNVIIGYSNLLSEDYYDFNDEKRIKYIKEIEDSANNTFELLDNLLTWSRSQQGIIEIKKENISLYIFVSKIIENNYATAKLKEITITNNIPVEVSIEIDKYTFKIILINILNNASKFTNIGGRIEISSEILDKEIEIYIRDTGVGMAQKVVDNLFSIEKNKSTNGTNNEKGTGLGLILCKEFTQKNNGSIRVESELNKGTTFILKFPL